MPGVRGRVRRYSRIHASFRSPDGSTHQLELEGWAARVFQHECDHVHGRLYDHQEAGRCSLKEEKLLVKNEDGETVWCNVSES